MLKGNPTDRRKAPRISTNGKLPGPIISEATGAEVICRSFDVSRIGIGITCDPDLPLETRLSLIVGGRKIALSVVSSYQPSDSTSNKRLGLFLVDSNIDLESIFRNADCIPNVKETARGQSLRMAPRFAPDQEISLQMRTFGTQNSYNFIVENLSHSGLLVATTLDETLPFRVNTLVDMTVDKECRAFKTPILATGKIVRRFDDTAGASQRVIRIGLAIIDIDPRQQDEWAAALEALEQDAVPR